MVHNVYFIVKTVDGVTVRTTKEYWERIVNLKHPSVKPFEKEIKQTLATPDQIRKSTQDAKVKLYYKSIGKLHLCVVVDCTNTNEGYKITSYLTDRIKEGEQIYVKN